MQVVYFLVKTHIASLVAFQIVISCLAKSSKLEKDFVHKKGSHKSYVQKKTIRLDEIRLTTNLAP